MKLVLVECGHQGKRHELHLGLYSRKALDLINELIRCCKENKSVAYHKFIYWVGCKSYVFPKEDGELAIYSCRLLDDSENFSIRLDNFLLKMIDNAKDRSIPCADLEKLKRALNGECSDDLNAIYGAPFNPFQVELMKHYDDECRRLKKELRESLLLYDEKRLEQLRKVHQKMLDLLTFK